MDKYDIVYYNTNKLLRLLSSNNAPDWLQKEFRDYISYYMQNTTWLARSKFQELTNGCYVGDTDTEGRRHGEGIYMFDDGDVYIGSYISGSKHGDGFYYDASSNLMYYGGWENDDKHGHGYVWGPGYESQGYYQNGKEIRNDYVRNGSGYHSNNTSISDEEGKGCGCLIMIVVAVLIWWIFF